VIALGLAFAIGAVCVCVQAFFSGSEIGVEGVRVVALVDEPAGRARRRLGRPRRLPRRRPIERAGQARRSRAEASATCRGRRTTRHSAHGHGRSRA
jgi:hypothetical protein